MLQIRAPEVVTSEDAHDLLRRDLLACHGRIRHFTQVAGRLAGARDASPDDIREAAHALVDYFGRALGLHVLDEEESILPRLRPRPELAAALARMHAEHPPLEALVSAGVDRWRRLIHTPSALPELSRTLGELAMVLQHGFHTHLAGEERDLFPHLASLDDDEVVAIRHEMRDRRRRR